MYYYRIIIIIIIIFVAVATAVAAASATAIVANAAEDAAVGVAEDPCDVRTDGLTVAYSALSISARKNLISGNGWTRPHGLRGQMCQEWMRCSAGSLQTIVDKGKLSRYCHQ